MAQEPSLLHSQWTCPGPGVGLDTTAPLSTLCPKPEEGGSFLQPCLEARFTGQLSCWVCRRGQGAKALPLEVNMTDCHGGQHGHHAVTSQSPGLL